MPIVANAPSDARAYRGILVSVPDEVGIKIASVEKIQRDVGIFLILTVSMVRKTQVIVKSKIVFKLRFPLNVRPINEEMIVLSGF